MRPTPWARRGNGYARTTDKTLYVFRQSFDKSILSGKTVKIVYEKPYRIDDMYENCELGDFRTRFHRRL